MTTAEMKDLGRLRRSVTDRHVAGVAGGLARHLDVDPILIRVAFVIGAFFGGAGVLLYLAVWLFVPEEGTQDQPLGLDERSRVAVLVIAAALALLAAVGDWAGA
ncbi:MAG: PspC domain-containing protein, partial [Nocardioides sp.]|nr:PspC domain-containing protein [Nocardioides sp.]